MRRLVVIAAIGLALGAVASADPITLNTSSGTWTDLFGGNPAMYEGIGTSTVYWGKPAVPDLKSGLTFTGVTQSAPVTCGDPFLVGTLTHYNRVTLPYTTAANQAELNLVLGFTPAALDVDTTVLFDIDETPNVGGPVDDIIDFPAFSGSTSVIVDEVKYTFNLLGFSLVEGGTIVDQFVSPEGGTNTAYLYGQVTCEPAPVIPAPGAILLGALGTGIVGWFRRRRVL